jgi:hypothetical protein
MNPLLTTLGTSVVRHKVLFAAWIVVVSLAVYRIGFSKPSPIVNQAQVEREEIARG